MFIGYYLSKVGSIQLCADEHHLLSCEFVDNPGIENRNHIIDETIKQLSEYFNGTRFTFDLPLRLIGTDFQMKVWNALMNIPYGKTCSYLDIASMIDMPKACRAVGNANNKNKFVIIIPCHRVIGKNKKMVGYAAGIDRKIQLLEHEALNC